MTEKELEQYRDIKRERDFLDELINNEVNSSEALTILQKRYAESIQRLSDRLIAIENAIETLEPRERQAVRLHYIAGLTWEEVGYKMYYERSQIFRIRKSAIEKLKSV